VPFEPREYKQGKQEKQQQMNILQLSVSSASYWKCFKKTQLLFSITRASAFIKYNHKYDASAHTAT
jgi:hypothetical protein